ncbi:GDP-mannose 4,6-dehydratase [Acidobacteria bacterium AH-259-D05]|nr:GDP-mannose 4,6-dehydratase [Acidobacteria bacterium AH-259-D05]
MLRKLTKHTDRLIEKLVDSEANLKFRPRHPADVTATWADISKAEKLLEWKPIHDFQQGVESLLSRYKANRSWGKEIAT